MQFPGLGGTPGQLDNAESTSAICVPCAVFVVTVQEQLGNVVGSSLVRPRK